MNNYRAFEYPTNHTLPEHISIIYNKRYQRWDILGLSDYIYY